MSELHVLQVFQAADGGGGNGLGVFLDGSAVAVERRQAIAHELGFAETVYVDRIAGGRARIVIHTPTQELRFAGHPTVGTSWLLRRSGHDVDVLEVPAGDVETWSEGDLTWIRARAAWFHDMEVRQLPSAADVDAVDGAGGVASLYVWAWIDEAAGVLRSRYFLPGRGIAEDEATGGAAVVMGDRLGRPLLIRQGRGSELHVRPGPDGATEVGGRVTLTEVRQHPTG